jgi:PhnB protein
VASKLNVYLNFNGNARQAMEFYKSVFGGKLDMQTFGEMPMPDTDPSDTDKIMHASLIADNGMSLMGADTPKHIEYKAPAAFGLSLSGEDEAELRGYWDKLAEGGTVTMPLEKAPWGDTFGMLTDQFGIDWLVNIDGSNPTNS